MSFLGFKKGVNLGGWFSQCDHTKETYDNFIKENDFQVISSWKLDHVRLPIDYNLLENNDGEYKEEGFNYIDSAINMAIKYNLNIILDLHKTAGYSFDESENESGFFTSEKYQEIFYKLWEELATRFSKYGDKIAFELLNEVTDQSFCEKWNEISQICIKRIRKIAPTTKILVGSYWNNSVVSVKDLLSPADENIIYNFHCYEPLIFTHQGAGWVKEMTPDYRIKFTLPVKELLEETKKMFPGNVAMITPLQGIDGNMGSNYFEQLFSETLKVAKERNVNLYCGEYGVIDLADKQETLAWYKSINKVFEKYNIGRAAWNYRELNFDLAGEHLNAIRDELIKYL